MDAQEPSKPHGNREDFEVEVLREIRYLDAIFLQRGADGLISLMADEIVRLRRLALEPAWQRTKSALDLALKAAPGSGRGARRPASPEGEAPEPARHI